MTEAAAEAETEAAAAAKHARLPIKPYPKLSPKQHIGEGPDLHVSVLEVSLLSTRVTVTEAIPETL